MCLAWRGVCSHIIVVQICNFLPPQADLAWHVIHAMFYKSILLFVLPPPFGGVIRVHDEVFQLAERETTFCHNLVMFISIVSSESADCWKGELLVLAAGRHLDFESLTEVSGACALCGEVYAHT